MEVQNTPTTAMPQKNPLVSRLTTTTTQTHTPGCKQGGAADVVMMAMLNIQRSQKLRELGWTLLLQVCPWLDGRLVVWERVCGCLWVMVDDTDVHGCVCLFGRRRIERADR